MKSDKHVIYKNWRPYLRVFRSPRLLQAIFIIEDLQGDGDIYVVLGAFYRSVQLRVPFPGDKIRVRCDLRLFREK